MHNLKHNKKVDWLIRLISYDPASEEGLSLSIGKLEKLGIEENKFVFVADYDELRAYKAADAVKKVGSSFDDPKKHVSAIIFPRPGRDLYPASARGVLQTIVDIEDTVDIDEERRFNVRRFLSNQDVNKLKDKRIISYTLENTNDDYKSYCDIVYRFRCDGREDGREKYAAVNLLGNLGADWHPFGFSKSTFSKDECDYISRAYCAISDWNEDALVKDFGARIFLIKNISISSIDGRYMIDFENPSHQVIPDLGIVSPEE